MIPDWLKNRTSVIEFVESKLPSVPVVEIEAIVDASAGTDCGDTSADPPVAPVVVYRPWYVLASLLNARTGLYKRVRSATGSEVEYASDADAVSSTMAQQAAFDSLLCGVPEAFKLVQSGFGSLTAERVY